MTIVLPATLATAAAAAVLNIWLAWRVGQVRRSEKIFVGDGGNLAVIARMRAHANFAEFTPIILILLGLLELAKGTSPFAWAYGAVFVIARIAHGVGMDSWKPGRGIGIGLTLLVTLFLAAECGVTAFQAVHIPRGVGIPVELDPSA